MTLVLYPCHTALVCSVYQGSVLGSPKPVLGRTVPKTRFKPTFYCPKLSITAQNHPKLSETTNRVPVYQIDTWTDIKSGKFWTNRWPKIGCEQFWTKRWPKISFNQFGTKQCPKRGFWTIGWPKISFGQFWTNVCSQIGFGQFWANRCPKPVLGRTV